MSEWSDRVQRDPKQPSADSLNEIQLRDHLPMLLDNLNQRLGDVSNEELKERADSLAALHGNIRWKEDYDIGEIVQEFAVLRSTIIPHLIEFQENSPDIGGASLQFALIVLHRFFDDAIRESIEQFMALNERSKKS